MIIESESLLKKHQIAKKALKDHRDANSDVFKTDKRLKKEYEWFKEMLLRYEFSKQQDRPTSDSWGSMVPSASLPIIICVENTSNKRTNATIFGAAMNSHLPNHGNPSNIKVTSGNTNVSYQQILSNTLSTCFSCSYVRLIDVKTPNQVQQSWRITSINMEGQLVSTPVPVSCSFSPFQQQCGIIDLIYPLKIDALTHVEFDMLGKTTLTLYIYPATVISPIHKLINGKPERNYSTPRIPSVFSNLEPQAVKNYVKETGGSIYYPVDDSVKVLGLKDVIPSKTEEIMGNILTTLQEIEKRQKAGDYPVIDKSSWVDTSRMERHTVAMPSEIMEPKPEVVTSTAAAVPEIKTPEPENESLITTDTTEPRHVKTRPSKNAVKKTAKAKKSKR